MKKGKQIMGIIAVIALSIVGCKDKTQIKTDKNEPKQTTSINCNVTIKNRPTSLKNGNYFLFAGQNGSYFYYSNADKKVYMVDTVKNSTPVLTHDFSAQNFSGTEFPVLTKENEIVIIDRHSIYRSSVSRSTNQNLDLFQNGHLYLLCPNHFNRPVYDEQTNCIFTPIFNDDEELAENFRTLPCVGKIDLNTNKFSIVNITFPSGYKDDVSYDQLETPMLTIMGRNLIIAFGLSNDVIKYNIDNGSISSQSISLPITLSNPMQINPITRPEELEEMIINNNVIQSINSNHNRLYVLSKAKQTSLKPKFWDNTYLSILDENLNTIQEYRFNPSELENYKNWLILQTKQQGITLKATNTQPADDNFSIFEININ